jgi:hypothetical protein
MTTVEGLLEAVFLVGSAPRLYVYNVDTSRAAVSWQQFSWVKWSNWLVSEGVQLSVESQPVKRRLEGYCKMAASMGPS